MESTAFRVNSPTVVSETVDREVVMIHLDTGNYYSLRSTGALIWDALERGATVASITAALDATAHNGADVGAVVGSFVDELMAEALIVPAGDVRRELVGDGGAHSRTVRTTGAREVHRHAAPHPLGSGARGRRGRRMAATAQ